MSLTPGDGFAGYTIVRLLGSGGMGEVYLAQHPRLPRHDALKVLRPDVSGDSDFRQRFVREADTAASLSHPNIVKVHDKGEFQDQLWIATEYVQGTDAGQLLRDRYPEGMPVEEVSSVVTAIASALDYAHDRGLLHRDVKPANILLSDADRYGERHAFLADFGIARPLADPSGLTATNLTVGTVAYAAPEQLMGEDIDGRADEYALAATAFHLLSGTTLYENSNPIAVISSHLNAPVPKLGDRRPELAGLDEVMGKALAKKPAERFDSCNRFAKALSDQAGLPSSGPPTDVEPTLAAAAFKKQEFGSSVGTPRRVSRRSSLIAFAALAVLAVLVATTIHFVNRKPTSIDNNSGRPSQNAASVGSGPRAPATTAEDSSAYKADVVGFTQVGESLSVQIHNPNSDVGLVRSPFELAMVDDKGAVIANAGQEGLPGSKVSTIYQLPPGGEYGLSSVRVPPGKKVASVELTITGNWLKWDSVNPPLVEVSGEALQPDPGYSGPSATGRVSLDKDGPLNAIVIAFVKTPVGTVVSDEFVDCMRVGQRRGFETKSFDDVRGPYELEKIVAYPTSVKGAGTQFTPSC